MLAFSNALVGLPVPERFCQTLYGLGKGNNMDTTLMELNTVEHPQHGLTTAHNEWAKIFDAAKQVLKTHPQRGGIYADYEAKLTEGLIRNLNGNYKADMVYGHPDAIANREVLYELANSRNLEDLYAKLESEVAARGDVKKAYQVLQAELKLAQVAELTTVEQAGINAVASVENMVANRVLGALRTGGPFLAGVTAADIVVAVKTWVDQLPDTASMSPEMADLKKYVQEHGAAKANDHLLNQYMQRTEPTP